MNASLFSATARKCRDNLYFDHKIFETSLVNTGHWYSSRKGDKCFSSYLSEQVVYFQKKIIILFCVIIYSYLQRFFKVSVLKTLCPIHRKTAVLESLFIQQVSCYFFIKRLRRFLVDIAKLAGTRIFIKLLETPDSVLMEHIYNYKIIKFNFDYPSGFSNHLKSNACTWI